MGNHKSLVQYTHKYQYKDASYIMVTGASSGLGKEISLEYSKRPNVTLLLVARNQERLGATKAECERNGATVLTFICNLSDEEQCKKLCLDVQTSVDTLDILVLNAGVNAHSKFQDLKDLSTAHSLMDTNYFANVYLVKGLMHLMKRSRTNIVVINSMSGKFGLPDRSIYCASKFALNGFFDALRTQDLPINITMVYPPSIDTPMRDHDLLKGEDHHHNKEERMSAKDCSKLIVLAADYKIESFYFPTKAYLANYLYPIFPKLIRERLKKAAKL